MRSFLVGSALCALVCCVVGCAPLDTSSSEASSDLTGNVPDPLADDVDVQPDRLVFTNAARSSAGFDNLVSRVRSYQGEYRRALEAAPASARASAEATDAWAVEELRGRQVEPVILVGRRNSAALQPDGTLDSTVRNPNGYLRRAVGVTEGANGEVVVLTQPSNLVEARAELERLGMMETRAEGDDDGWVYERSYPFSVTDIDLNRTLYEKQLPAGLGNVRIGFKDSYLRVNGNFDARAHGRWARLRDARAVLTTNLDGQLKVEGTFDGAFAASTGEKKLYGKQVSITSVGGYPLAMDFTVNASCDFGANGRASAVAGARITGSAKAGGEYDRERGGRLVWQPQYPQFQRVGPSVGSNARVEGTCTLTTIAKAMVFDQGGPEAIASTFVKVEVNASGSAGGGSASGRADVQLTGGVDARLGGSLRPFGFHLMDVSSPGFRREWVLFNQQVSVSH